MPARIICIGNRFLAADAAGPLVYDLLARSPLPGAVELIEGGTTGLRLLPLLEDCDLVVFVDAVRGFRPDPGVVIIDPSDLDLQVLDFGHGAGIAALIATAQHVLDPPLPEIRIVGIEGQADEPACVQAARVCCEIIVNRSSRQNRLQTASVQDTVDERSGH
jgi:hydrogenase maturation protease